MRIHFICEGNMMRSQMAEAFYNHYTHSHDATSSGANATLATEMWPTVTEVMAEKGISMDGHTSKQLTQDMFDAADKVVIFPTPYMPRSVKEHEKTIAWDVSDPYYMPGDQLDLVRRARDRIDENIKVLLGMTK